MNRRCQVLIVGSGFAGSILARILALQGRDVVLVERGRHPRFALGESATPLAALCLERLARRYGRLNREDQDDREDRHDLADLHALAAHGRWSRRLPHLRRGLKRGFTFFHHRSGHAFHNSPANNSRLLVAASPDDEAADSHWHRADVDHHLVQAAAASGVEVLEETELHTLEEEATTVRVTGQVTGRVTGRGSGGPLELQADLLVDASGPGGFVARALSLPCRPPTVQRDASLLYAHLEGVRPFAEVAREAGVYPDGPYPDDRAAVHHLLDRGWIYVLPLDDGVCSVGLVGAGPHGEPPEDAWKRTLARYPSLHRAFVGARAVHGFRHLPNIRHRLPRAAGRRWLMLPHAYAFFDPLYSTGMGWSLSAVERIAALCERSGLPDAETLARYAALLEVEADHVEDLIEGAYAALPDFAHFVAQSFLYFAAASFQEVQHRLLGKEWGWEGFLGATDPITRAFVAEGRRRLEADGADAKFQEWVLQAIAERNIAGLGDPARNNLYPLDLDTLVERADLLGFTPGQMEAALPRLRSL